MRATDDFRSSSSYGLLKSLVELLRDAPLDE